MHSLIRIVVIGFTVVTLMLAAAVGVSAASGSFGTSNGSSAVSALFGGHLDFGAFLNDLNTTLSNGLDKEVGQCHPPKKHHKHGTPGHKNHPCGDNDGDTD
jgi:hypothetical protein